MIHAVCEKNQINYPILFLEMGPPQLEFHRGSALFCGYDKPSSMYCAKKSKKKDGCRLFQKSYLVLNSYLM